LNRFAPICCGLILVGLVVVGMVGCGPGSTPVEAPTGISRAELIRNDLKMVVDNGQLGSEMSTIEDNLAIYREEQPQLAAELLTDLEALQKLSGPPAKAKATAMIAKLK